MSSKRLLNICASRCEFGFNDISRVNVNVLNYSYKQSLYMIAYFLEKQSLLKVYHDLTPTYISENYVQRNEMEMSIQLRSTAAGCFVPPRPKREYFKQSMRYSGRLIWNSLPN